MKAIVGVFAAAAALAATDAVQAQSSGTSTPPAATTQAAAPPGSSPTGPNSADGQKMVCRSGRLIGSRLPAPTVCKTQWQWDEQRRIARKEIEYDQIRGFNQ
jgi:hypothetical protein